jgi:hypothetical protein
VDSLDEEARAFATLCSPAFLGELGDVDRAFGSRVSVPAPAASSSKRTWRA